MGGDQSWLLASLVSKDIFFIILLLFLIITSGLCSAIETAMSSLNIIRVKQLSQSGSKKQRKRAKRVYQLEKTYSSVLNTVLVLNNIVNVAVSSIVTFMLMVSLNLQENAVVVSTIFSSIAIIIFAEIMPKNLAKMRPEKTAMTFSFLALILTYFFKPITILFDIINKKIEESATDGEERVTATEDELVEIVETIEREGVLEHNESELIKSAIMFDEISVKTAMKNKEDVISLKIDMSFNAIAEKFITSSLSRMPIFNEKAEIIGVVNQKDVFEVLYNNKDLSEEEKIKSVIKAPVYISYRRLLSDALEKAQRNAEHLLIVVDNMKEKNYLGIISLEDILEELVGEIYDEHDVLPKDIIEIGNHIFWVSAHYDLEDLFDDYLEDSHMPNKKFTTVGQWVKSLFKGKIKIGKIIKYDNLEIKIVEIDKDKKTIKEVEIVELTQNIE